MGNTNDSQLTQIISIVQSSQKLQQENQKIQQENQKIQQKLQQENQKFHKILEAVVSETKEFREEQQTRYIQQRKEDDKRFETTQHQIAALSAKLDRIEANTIIIKDVLISDFAGISPAMKKAIETAGQAAMEDQEVIDTVAEIRGEKPCALVRKPSGKFAPKQRPVIGIKEALDNLGEDVRTDRRAIGIWVSGVMSKLFCTNFHGKYPPKTVDLVGNLVLFHQTERSENGRKY